MKIKRQKYIDIEPKIKVKISEIISNFFCLFLVVFLLLSLMFTIRFVNFKVEGASMEGNYFEKDIVYVDTKLEVNYGDVVVVYEASLEGTKDEKGNKVDPYILKRVVGLPGDFIQIELVFDKYIIKLNNEILIESYLTNEWTENYGTINNVTLGDNDVYVLGDNRNKSVDSRYNEIGVKKLSDIVGVVKLKIKKDENFFEHILKRIDFILNSKFFIGY